MNVDLKYGEGVKTIQIPERVDVAVLQPQRIPALTSPQEALEEGLANPLGGDAVGKLAHWRHSPRIAIAIPDQTRAVPVRTLLPILMKHLYQRLPQLNPSTVTIVIGGGLHPPPDPQALRQLLPPEVAVGCRIEAHDAHASPLSDLGTTQRGTPLLINRTLAEADVKIVIGQIDPHQFVGFTGGSKGVVIGCGGPDTIQHNHSLMFAENAAVGRLEDNPVRQDLNEAGRMIGIDLAVNVVLSPNQEVVRVLVGEPDAVLTQGAKTCAAIYGVELTTKYDMVVASCGGTPKDSVLYQAQKGLNLASHAVKKGGKILLLAACQQGIGDDIYFDYVCQFATPEAVLKDFKQLGFTMGGKY